VEFNRKRRAFGSVIFVALIWLMYSTAIAQPQERHRNGCEKRKGLVILVEFPDIVPPVREGFVRERFKKLDVYIREMSYGKVCTEVDITGWHRLPDSIRRYSISPANLQVDKSRVAKLIQDAIDGAGGKNDFRITPLSSCFSVPSSKNTAWSDSVDIRVCSDGNRPWSSGPKADRLFKEELRSSLTKHTLAHFFMTSPIFGEE